MFVVVTIIYIVFLIYYIKHLAECSKFIDMCNKEDYVFKNRDKLEKFIKFDKRILGISIIILIVLCITYKIAGDDSNNSGYSYFLITMFMLLQSQYNVDKCYIMKNNEIILISQKIKLIKYDQIRYIEISEVKKNKIDYKKILFTLNDYSIVKIRVKPEEIVQIVNFLENKEIRVNNNLSVK